jgi:DNA-binding response OmpR family regulator
MASSTPVPTTRVLVAEDDDAVRSILERCLVGEGYSVLSAADGAAALAALQVLQAPVDLLIADIRMPRMSGDTLAFRAMEAGLTRRVLLLTGYDAQPDTAQMLGPVMQKPFSPNELCAMVSALLRGDNVCDGGGPSP